MLDRNWRSAERDVRGELDLVVGQGGLVVFCEVKARRRSGYGGAAAAVDPAKQARIRVLAEAWLRVHRPSEVDVRFDVIAVDGVTLTHIESAF